MTVELKTGKKDPTYDKRDFRYAQLAKSVAITPPNNFGHGKSFADWGMLGNDKYGDCVIAGGDHEVMLLNNLAAGGQTGLEVVKFTEDNALSDYSAVTGFKKDDPSTDQGTEVRQALKYRQSTGLIDSQGKRHKIAAYVSLEPGNVAQLLQATFIFEVVGIGFQFPESAMDQFNEGKVWSVVSNAPINGGHYIPIVGRPQPGYLGSVTWGQRQIMTEGFYKKYCDEAWGLITLEELNKRTQKNWGGFAWKDLEEDLRRISS